MGLLKDGWLLSYTESQENESHVGILRASWPDSPETDWLKFYGNGQVGKKPLGNASADLYEPGVEDMMAAVKVLLQGLGEDVSRDGLLKTPLRVARAFLFATKGYRQVAEDIVGDAMFPEAGLEDGVGCGGGSGGMVVVRNIDLFSLCQACLLPFKVCCHVAYISDGQQVVGLSKLSRVAEMYARRLQTPHRLAEEISQVLADTIRPLGVAVVVQCWHPHLPGSCDHDSFPRDISEQHRHWQPFSVCAGKGQFEDKRSDAWCEFLGILLLDDIVIDNLESAFHDGFAKDGWCHCFLDDEHALPGSGLSLPSSETSCNGSSKQNLEDSLSQSSEFIPGEAETRVNIMIAAVEVILHAICQDLKREEVQSTSKRFVHWLLHFDCRVQDINMHTDNFEADGSFIGVNGHNLGPSLNEELEISLTRDGGNSPLLVLTIPFFSQCEHHLLPFYGVAHIGYFARERERPLERTIVQMVVQALSRRLQVQERLTKQIAEVTVRHYGVQSVMVALEASHICMISRGIEKLGSSTATIAVTGRFATDISAKVSFLQKISTRGVKENWT